MNISRFFFFAIAGPTFLALLWSFYGYVPGELASLWNSGITRAESSPVSHSGDVTVVLLNWKRLPNNVLIVAEVCRSEHVAQVRIWNNNPNITLSHADFASTRCPAHKIWIYNSPHNLYFQARYIACASVATTFCFLQDDDYLVRSHIIKTLYLQAKESPEPSRTIHLAPPEDHLKSALMVVFSPQINTTLSWLGYGTILTAELCRDFLHLLHDATPPFSADERNMADNYFSILSNRLPEIWLDQGEPLSHGDAFTVGTEGDDRNWRYAQKALDRLYDMISNGTPAFDFINPPQYRFEAKWGITQAPCHRSLESCLVETNIPLLPLKDVHHINERVDNLDIRKTYEERRSHFKESDIQLYINHSLSAAVDGVLNTTFRSPHPGRKGEYIIYDLLRESHDDAAVLEILVPSFWQDHVVALTPSSSNDGASWTVVDLPFSCSEALELTMCHVQFCEKGLRYLRIQLNQDIPNQWVIGEFQAILKQS